MASPAAVAAAAAGKIHKDVSVFSQSFPPAPAFTESQLGSLAGRSVLITGATSGIGLSLAKLVYEKGADVVVTGREAVKLESAVKEIQSSSPSSAGRVRGLLLDLADLSSIKQSAADLLQLCDRLDVLVHNAGVMKPTKERQTKLGHDLEMGTNCLGPYLLNQLLEPLLLKTASSAAAASVRVLWVASMVAVGTVQGGIRFDDKTGGPLVLSNAMENYMQSKVGNVFLASESAKRLGAAGVISLSLHPGILKTNLNRHAPALQQRIMGALLKSAIYGAYTELFAAFSPDVTAEDNGAFVVPWGRFANLPPHIAGGLATAQQGGTGLASRFVQWCDRETAPFQ